MPAKTVRPTRVWARVGSSLSGSELRATVSVPPSRTDRSSVFRTPPTSVAEDCSDAQPEVRDTNATATRATTFRRTRAYLPPGVIKEYRRPYFAYSPQGKRGSQ